jgi:hypothetical protein
MRSISGPHSARHTHSLVPLTRDDIFATSHENSCSHIQFVACEQPAAQPLGGDSQRRAAEPPSGVAAGLVYSQTSGMREGRVIRVDREANRIKRLQRSVLTAARLHVQQRPRWKVAMLTLTYRPDVDWAAGQVSALVRHIRQYLARKGISMRFVWVQEFTKKGRPHYHMLLWLPLGISLPKPDKRGWWPCGMTKIEWARNAVGYIAKYASKGDSLAQPSKGARMHGGGGLTDEALLEQRWWRLPTWLRSDVEPSDRVRRAAPRSGGGFIHPGTAEVYRSPWIVFFQGGQVFIKRRGI